MFAVTKMKIISMMKTTSMAVFLFFYGLGRRSQENKVSLSQKVIT